MAEEEHEEADEEESTTETYSDSDGPENLSLRTGGSRPQRKSRPK